MRGRRHPLSRLHARPQTLARLMRRKSHHTFLHLLDFTFDARENGSPVQPESVSPLVEKSESFFSRCNHSFPLTQQEERRVYHEDEAGIRLSDRRDVGSLRCSSEACVSEPGSVYRCARACVRVVETLSLSLSPVVSRRRKTR